MSTHATTRKERLEMLQTTDPQLSEEIKLITLMIENNEIEKNNLVKTYINLCASLASVKDTLHILKLKHKELIKKAHIS